MGFISYRDQVIKVLDECSEETCNKIGLTAVGEAQSLVPVDTGNLRRSITHEVMPEAVGVIVGVTAAAPYALAIEKGHSSKAPEGYLEPGCLNAIPKIKDVVGSIYRNRFGGA